MSNILNDLNIEQQQAVQAVEGPVIVFAGAGTGKTKTLTARIAYLIKEKNVNPEHILAITFTKKATNEMRERIMSAVGPYAGKVTISTIHSLCAQILRRHIQLIGYKNNFEILDDEDSLKIIQDLYKEENIDRKFLSPKAAMHMISSYKNGMAKLVGIVENIYQSYQKYLFSNNLVDFDDLLLLTHQVLNGYPDVLEYYHWKFQYILVDEFQDTNKVQYQIIKLLAGEKQNVFVVGDDDQSIYSFRGACVDNMFAFMKEFNEVKVIKLIKNYRSTNAILKGSNAMIANNQNREPKELYSDRPGTSRDVVLHEAPYFEDEARFVASEIQSLVRNGYRYDEIAVVYRNNVISRYFELAFIESRIPYNIFGGFSYLKRKEVKDVISYLRFILNSNNFVHFKRIINQPARGIGEKTIEKIKEYMDKESITLFEAIDHINKGNPSTKYVTLLDFKNMILELQKQLNQMPLDNFFDLMLVKTGYLEMIQAEDNQEINREANIQEFKSILYKIGQYYQDESLSNQEILERGFDEIILDETLGDEQTNKKGVVLSTVHSIKGLEFHVVFVVAFEEGIFPAMREDADIEEERRVAYVAFTRPKDKIYLTCATRRLIYGRIVKNAKSRFLTEYLNCQELLKTSEETPVIPKKVPGDIKVHDRIYHSSYGYGFVISVVEPTIQVIFEKDNSIRKILKNHPSVIKC